MTKIMISPSILSGDFAKMGETVAKTCEWGARFNSRGCNGWCVCAKHNFWYANG